MFEKVASLKREYDGTDGIICLHDDGTNVSRHYRKTCHDGEEQITTNVMGLRDLIEKHPRKDWGICVADDFCVDSSASIVNINKKPSTDEIGACITDGFDPKKFCIVGNITQHNFVATKTTSGMFEMIPRLEKEEREMVEKTVRDIETLKKSSKEEKNAIIWIRIDPLTFVEIKGRTMIVDDYKMKNVALISYTKPSFDPIGRTVFMGFPRLSCQTRNEQGLKILACTNAIK